MKIKLSFILLILTSCQSSITFNVENHTGKTLDSVVVSNGTDKVIFKDLLSGESAENPLKFSDSLKSDGSYYFESYAGGNSQRHTFGYFTNGAPLESMITIEIEKDTFKIKNER